MPSPTGWSAVDPVTPSGNDHIDPLLSGTRWSAHTLSYSFPDSDSTWSKDDVTGYGGVLAGGEPWSDGYRGLSLAQKGAVETALGQWASVANIVFTKVAESASSVGDLRFAFVGSDDPPELQAYAYLPEEAAYAGDVWFNRNGTSFTAPWDPGSFEYLTALHEIGHALGLKHPFEQPGVLPSELDSRSFTIMSYSAVPGVQFTVFSTEPTTPMVLDIAALQHMYEANNSRNAGDTTYTFAADVAIHQTIWDAGGIDTIVSQGSRPAVIDLRGGLQGSRVTLPVYSQNQDGTGRSLVDNLWIAFDTVIENATGGGGADRLTGNSAGNVLLGNAGKDTLWGGSGDDTINGGAGIDTASYTGAVKGGVIVRLDTTDAQRTGRAGTDVLLGIENLAGSNGDDRLTGNDLANALSGADGDDTLSGGAGADRLDGGAGFDLVSYASAAGGVIANLGAASGEDELLGIESLIGSRFADKLTGNDTDNTLNGGAGADTLSGANGGDTYYVDSSGDQVIDDGWIGVDVVYTRASSFSLGNAANIERVVIDSAGSADVHGNDGANLVVAGTGNNLIDGGDGGDIVDYSGAAAAIAIDLGNSSAQATGGSGIDTLLSIEGLIGTRFADALNGSAAANTLDGGAGDDTLAGAAGDDLLNGSGGSDTVVFEHGLGDYRFGITQNGELSIAGSGAANGADGSDLLRGIESVQFADRALTDLSAGIQRINSGDGQVYELEGATLLDGTHIVVWTNSQSSQYSVRVQHLDEDGAPIGTELSIDEGQSASHASVTALADGGYVIAWQGIDSISPVSGDSYGVFAQRFTADGTATTAATRLNTLAGGSQTSPAIATLSDGGYVVVWESDCAPDGLFDLYEIHARLFDADGTARGGEFRVDSISNVMETDPLVTALEGGGFVVGWNSFRNGYGIYTQQFDGDGARTGTELQVDSSQGSWATLLAIDGVAGGGYTVVWSGSGAAGAGTLAQRYDTNGAPVGTETRLSANSASEVLLNADGSYLIGRVTQAPAGLPWLLAQRVAADGTPMGNEFALADFWHTAGSLQLLAAGDGFVAAWSGYFSNTLLGQRYDANGDARVLLIPGTDAADVLDIAGPGAIAAAGGAGNDIYVVNDAGDRLIESSGEGTDRVRAMIDWTLAANFEHLALLAEGGSIDGTGNAANNRITGNDSDNVLEGRGGNDTLDGAGGADTASYASAGNGVHVQLGSSGQQATGGAGKDTLIAIEHLIGSAYDDTLTGNAGANRLAGGAGNDTLQGNAGEDTLDGGFGSDTAVLGGGMADWRFSRSSDGHLTAQYQADSAQGSATVLDSIEIVRAGATELHIERGGDLQLGPSDLFQPQDHPRIAALADGGFVVTWSTDQSGTPSTDIFARLFDADGAPRGDKFLAVQNNSGYQGEPVVCALNDGGFAVAWVSDANSYDLDIIARRFAADGTPAGDEFQVNAVGDGRQANIQLAGLDGGGFVVVWESYTGFNYDNTIYARRFGADGSALDSGDVQVAATGTVQMLPAVSSLDDGGFVVAWQAPDGAGSGVFARSFGADGVAQSAAKRLNDHIQNQQFDVAVAGLAGGGFIATWVQQNQSGSSSTVRAQLYDADGVKIGTEMRVSASNAKEIQPVVVATADGGFAIGWLAETNYAHSAWVHRFDSEGNSLGDPLRVDDPPNSPASWMDALGLVALQGGGMMMAWHDILNTEGARIIGHRLDDQARPYMPGLSGTAAADTIDIAGTGALQARGGAGDDTYVVDAGDVPLESAGDGNDTVIALLGWTLGAELENLVLRTGSAGAGNSLDNRIDGNAEANSLSGLDGADTLDGAAGNDTLSGGAGADAFVFDMALASSGVDRVMDFQPGIDHIVLDNDVFAALGAAGALGSAQFLAGPGITSASTPAQRIVYDSTSGALYYDADGNGATPAVQIAVLGTSTQPALGAADLLIVA